MAMVNCPGIATVLQGLYSAIPTAGTAGRLYFATDQQALYFDNGTTWKNCSIALAESALTSDLVSEIAALVLVDSGFTSSIGALEDADSLLSSGLDDLLAADSLLDSAIVDLEAADSLINSELADLEAADSLINSELADIWAAVSALP